MTWTVKWCLFYTYTTYLGYDCTEFKHELKNIPHARTASHRSQKKPSSRILLIPFFSQSVSESFESIFSKFKYRNLFEIAFRFENWSWVMQIGAACVFLMYSQRLKFHNYNENPQERLARVNMLQRSQLGGSVVCLKTMNSFNGLSYGFLIICGDIIFIEQTTSTLIKKRSRRKRYCDMITLLFRKITMRNVHMMYKTSQNEFLRSHISVSYKCFFEIFIHWL